MRNFLVIAMIIVSCSAYGQQQSLYTQFMFNKMVINPAFAGNGEYITASAVYREQWFGIDGAPTLQQISLSIPLIDKNIGLGFNINQNTIGLSKKLTLDGMYAYKFDASHGLVSIGLQTSLRRYSLDFSDPRVITLDPISIDPSIDATPQNKIFANAGLGVYLHHDDYYLGVSVPRLISTDLDFEKTLNTSREKAHLYVMGGYHFWIREDIEIMPQLLWRWTSGVPSSIDINVNATFQSRYIGGLSFRSSGGNGGFGESLDIIGGIYLSPPLMLGIAYDIGLSSLRNYHSGSLEVLMTYTIGKKEKPSNFLNPRFY